MAIPLELIIADLRDEKEEVRERAAVRLTARADQRLTRCERRRALEAATEAWPEIEFFDPSSLLVQAALTRSDASNWTFVLDRFESFSKEGRARAISRLLDLKNKRAATIFMSLLERYAAGGAMPAPSLTDFLQSKKAINVLIPALLSYTHLEKFAFEIHLFVLGALQKKLVSWRTMVPYACRLLETYQAMRERLRALERPAGDDWIWEEDYIDHRGTLTLFLDLMGFLPGEAVIEALEEALTSRDGHVRCYAALSLMRHDRHVPVDVVTSIAANAHARNKLFDGMQRIGRSEQFPSRYFSYEAFAESQMVDWLTYPTELGRTPDELELMETFDQEDDEERYYLYRFRSGHPDWVDHGWMAAIAGPYFVLESPDTYGGAGTFSNFEAWEKNTPRQHFEEITGMVARFLN